MIGDDQVLSFAGLSVEYAGVETGLAAIDEILFRVWREACRHGELAKSVGAITVGLTEHLPIDLLLGPQEVSAIDAVDFHRNGSWHPISIQTPEADQVTLR